MDATRHNVCPRTHFSHRRLLRSRFVFSTPRHITKNRSLPCSTKRPPGAERSRRYDRALPQNKRMMREARVATISSENRTRETEPAHGCPSAAKHDRAVPDVDLLSPLTIRGL